MKKISLLRGRYIVAAALLPIILVAGAGKVSAAGNNKHKQTKNKYNISKIQKKRKVSAYRVHYVRLKNGRLVKRYYFVHIPSNQVPRPTQTVPTNTQSGYSAQNILDAINAQRRANGLAEVRINNSLNQAAANKSKDMSDQHYFAHTNPQGKSDFAFIDEVGYRYRSAGSNLAMGDFGSSDGVVNAWMNSPGHRANILASFGQEIGIGIYGNYFTMFITKPM